MPRYRGHKGQLRVSYSLHLYLDMRYPDAFANDQKKQSIAYSSIQSGRQHPSSSTVERRRRPATPAGMTQRCGGSPRIAGGAASSSPSTTDTTTPRHGSLGPNLAEGGSGIDLGPENLEDTLIPAMQS